MGRRPCHGNFAADKACWNQERMTTPKFRKILRLFAGAILVAATIASLTVHLLAARHAKSRVLGLNQVIAFTYSPKGAGLKQFHSATLIGPVGPGDWKQWQPRGVVTGIGHTWFDLLRSPIEKAVDNIITLDVGGNPHPLIMIDEFGFDYGGLMDQKAAQILRQVKSRKPELSLAVFEMRGPISQVLAEACRDTAGLIMMEGYVGNSRHYWSLAIEAWTARHFGILPKTILVLGVGKGGNPGENWAETNQELEQQIRFVRMIAPESPGVGFYAGTPELLSRADALCAHFFKFPANGAGLPQDARALANTFTRRYDKPTLVFSPLYVEPNFNEDGQGIAKPIVMRAYLINLGDQDAQNVKVRLRNPPNQGGKVFAEGVVPLIPKRSATVGVLPVTDAWKVWIGEWVMEVEATGCDLIDFNPEPPGK